MMGVCIPIGYYFAYASSPSIPQWGVIAAVVASLNTVADKLANFLTTIP